MDQQPKARMHLEGRLQAECVLWYRNEWYQHPRNLWATFNEGKDVSSKLSLGLTPFVSDLRRTHCASVTCHSKHPRHDKAALYQMTILS